MKLTFDHRQFKPVRIGVFTLAKGIMEFRSAVAHDRTQACEALDGPTAGLPAVLSEV